MYMKRLPNIEITQEQLIAMFEHEIFNGGTESIIYDIPSIFGNQTLAKVWRPNFHNMIPNKFEKLKRLYQIDQLKEINDIQILTSISYDGKIIGYGMSKSNYQKINSKAITRTEILYYLVKARQKLKQFEELGILYGDISNSNILIARGDVCFCDLDNVAYQELEMDITQTILDFFVRDYGKIDEKAVSYLYNIFTLKNLCHFDTNAKVEEYLETEQIPRELLPGPYRYIKEQMRTVTPFYEGYYLIDYVKEKYKQKVNSYASQLK